jgi:hypothetical protein
MRRRHAVLVIDTLMQKNQPCLAGHRAAVYQKERTGVAVLPAVARNSKPFTLSSRPSAKIIPLERFFGQS